MPKKKKIFYFIGAATIVPTTFAVVVSCGVNLFVNKTVNTDNYCFPDSLEFTGPENGKGQIKDIQIFNIPENTQLLYQVNNNAFQAEPPTNLRLFDKLSVKITGKANYVITKDQSHEYWVKSGFGNILSTDDQLEKFTTFDDSSGQLTINSVVDEVQAGVFDKGIYGEKWPSITSKIKSIVFAPNSQISIIDEDAFQLCDITTLDIPSSLEYIGNNSFQNANLKTLNINTDSKLISIGNNAFEASTLLGSNSLLIPNNVTTIGSGAFEDAQISSIGFLGTSLQSIGENAFSSLKVTSLTIPYSVVTIGAFAFKNVALKTLTFQSTNKNPSRLQVIDEYAFESSLLETLTIPASVQIISEHAFFESTITNLIFFGEVPSPNGRQLTLGNKSFIKTKFSAIQNGDHSKDEWLTWLKKTQDVFNPEP